MIATGIIPMSLSILLRISIIGKDVGSYLILESSPLLAESGTLPLDAEGTVRATIRWTLGQVCRAVDEAYERSKVLYWRAEPCLALFTKGKLILILRNGSI